MWGVIPAAGKGSRIQPLAFSKELLPVGSRRDDGTERPRAVMEYLTDRMVRAGVDKLCFVISPGKSDILEYFGSKPAPVRSCFAVQEEPLGLCDALFRAIPFIRSDERVLLGLPDTIWLPEDGFTLLPPDVLSFLLFPVGNPEYFDRVLTDAAGNVTEVLVKRPSTEPGWIWGAVGMPGAVFHEIFDLWRRPERGDEYLGTLVNAYLAGGGRAVGVRGGTAYVDVGTVNGYREAIMLLSDDTVRREVKDAEAAERTAVSFTSVDLNGKVFSESPGENEILTRERIEQRIRELGGWFHNMDLGGVKTAPDHFLGDYPAIKWNRFSEAVPSDLRGKSVLDIGCNAGFYSIEMKKRGAGRVVAMDWDDEYLSQARFAAQVTGFPDIEFRKLSVYDVALLEEKFDLVLFLGVFYHLRHPLLALDLLHEHVTRDLLVFQSMQRGSGDVESTEPDYPFSETAVFDEPSWPRLHFVEHRYSGDVTNWWIPNRACTEALLRSAGYRIVDHPEEEVYICVHTDHTEDIAGPRAVYPAGRKRVHG